MHLGGSVSNTGMAMLRIGTDVTLLGKIGQDAFGGMIRELTGPAGDHLIVDPGSETSYTLVLAIPGLDRAFLSCPGANDTFVPEDIPDSIIEQSDVFHFGYPTLMKQMYADGGEKLTGMFKRVKRYGIATSLDLAMIDPQGPAGEADWKAILASVLPYVDFFVPSFEELCYILDPEQWETVSALNGNLDSLSLANQAMPLAERALALGAGAVLLKCGTAGLVLAVSREERVEQIGRRLEPSRTWANVRVQQPCFPAPRVVSTSGAGDASIAAFLSAAAEGRDPAMCAALAAAEGAYAVTEYDSSGIQPLHVLEEKIRNGWTTKEEEKCL